MSRTSPILNVMIAAAEKAARSLVRDFGEVEQLQVSAKGPGDFVSAADRRAEEILYKELKKAYPKYSFLMEESGKIDGDDKDNIWIIDPLDGTTNFLHGIPHWAISIALQRKGEVIAGVVYDPVKNELFHAEKGASAFMRRKRLRVSGRSDLDSAVVATGAPRRSKPQKEQFMKEYNAALNVIPALRRFGAAALDLAYVAAGRYDAYWERDLKQWDIAAGMLILKESGGFYTDLDDPSKNPLITGNILASNAGIFEPMKKVLKAA
jgi:myo-inositol-1(or 4)-monophosphatase